MLSETELSIGRAQILATGENVDIILNVYV